MSYFVLMLTSFLLLLKAVMLFLFYLFSSYIMYHLYSLRLQLGIYFLFFSTEGEDYFFSFLYSYDLRNCPVWFSLTLVCVCISSFCISFHAIYDFRLFICTYIFFTLLISLYLLSNFLTIILISGFFLPFLILLDTFNNLSLLHFFLSSIYHYILRTYFTFHTLFILSFTSPILLL